MKQKILFAALGMGALGLAGCVKQAPAGSAPSSAVLSENARWTANIQSVTQSRGDVAQSTRDRSYGSLTWSRGDSPSLTVANIVFTYAGEERFLSWAIVAGNCGTPSLPILPLANFPELNIGGGSRAQVTTTLPTEFPTTGAYHVDIYRARNAGTENLVACGNLKLVGG